MNDSSLFSNETCSEFKSRTYEIVINEQERSRKAFGTMLLNWRKQNNWTQYTAGRWSKQCNFEMVSYGNLSVIEQGKAGELRQKTFFQLEELNRRLNNKDKNLKNIETQDLRNLIKNAKPLVGDDGKIWNAIDFWSCYIVYKAVPKLYWNLPKTTVTIKQTQKTITNNLPHDPYVACASLEWKLGIHLSEWKAARDLAKRLGKDPIADAAYLQGVKDLLNDFLLSLQSMQPTNTQEDN